MKLGRIPGTDDSVNSWSLWGRPELDARIWGKWSTPRPQEPGAWVGGTGEW